MTDATLNIRVDSSEVQRGKKSLDDLAVSGGKAEKGVDGVTKSTTSFSSAARVATGVITSLGVAMGVREIVQYADAWQNTTNQLKTVQRDGENLVATQEKLMMTANASRSGFESTANLYTRLSRATENLNLSQQQTIELTDTINKSFAVSGATAQEASNAITQLSQGLAAGALRGEEFNSVSEQSPILMQAIADSLKMTRGELRAFAADGGITAEIVVKALQEASDQIDETFNKMSATFGQNMEVAKNNLLEFVGSNELVVGATGAAGSAIVALSENIDLLGKAMTAVAAVGAARLAPVVGAQLVSAFAAASAALATATVVTTSYNAALMVTEKTIVTTTAAQKALNGALALVGGPAGLAVLAAIGIYKLATAYAEHENQIGKSLMSNEDLIESLGMTVDKNGKLVESTEAAASAAVKFQSRIKELEGAESSLAKTTGTVSNAVYETTQKLDHGKFSTNEKTKAVNELIDSLSTVRSSYAEWVPLLAKTEWQMQGMTDATGNQTRAIEFWTKVSEQGAERAAKSAEDAARATQEAWQDTHDYLSGAFVDIMNNGGNAFDNIAKAFERTVQRMVAEWAASGLMNLFGMGGGSSGGGFSFGGGGSGSSPIGTASSIANIGKTLGSILGGGSAATAAATSAGTSTVVGSLVGGGVGGVGTGAAAAGAGGGIGAGLAGIGSSIGAAASSAGSAVLGALQAIPGWGWALGGAALAAKLLDDSGTMSGNAGMLIRPVGNGDRQFDVPAFASGFDPVGFARREDQSTASQVIDVFRADDAVLTALAKASGIDVQYSANNFGGYNEKGNGSGLFLGTANEDGRNTAVPLDQQRTQFVSQWLMGLSGKVDQSLINDALSAGNADAMIARAAKLAGIDGSHANGLDYVPFDGYRAQLHKGEKVSSVAEIRSTQAANETMISEMRAMSTYIKKGYEQAKKTADLLTRVTRDGNALLTEVA